MALFDTVSLHAYWSTAGLTRWNALRWRLFAPPGVPILVTECGRDKVRDGPDGTYLPSDQGDAFGWQAQGIDGDAFLRELVAYDAELRADGVYAVVFTTSPDDEWRRKGFSVDDLADRCHGLTNIGPHDLMGTSPQALAWAARAPIVKSVDQTAAIRRARPDAITVYRRRFSVAEQDDMLERCDADRLVAAILDNLAGFRHPRLHVELLNEVGKGRRDQYVRLARLAVPRLRANGLLVAGPSWATGDYEQDDWAAFVAPQEDPVAVLKGIDVSNHQGHVDVGLVKADGVGFLAIKASGDEGFGNVFLDPFFPETWKAAGVANLPRIAYHYARPSAVTPAQSVTTLQRAVQAAGGLGAGDNVALDIEDPAVPDGVSLHVWVAEWLDLAERVFGVAPWKYSARYYTSTHDLEHADLDRYPTWWASYQATKPKAVTGWTPIRIWQNSASGRVNGVGGDVDTNVFDGTADGLRALGLREVVPPLPPPPPPAYDVEATRARLWALLDQIQAGATAWRDGGYPQHAALIEHGAETIKRGLAIGKNEP